MATNFPEDLDSLVNPQSTDSVETVSHSAQHADANDAIEALQAKVGVDGSAVVTSLDYRVTTLEEAPFDTEAIEDIIGGVLEDGTHDGITVTYDDDNNKINLSAADAITTANEYTDEAVTELENSLTDVYVPISDVGAEDGVAQLVGGFVPDSQLDIDERIQDRAKELIVHADHLNVTATYNEASNRVIFTAMPQLTQDEVQDFLAPLFTHGLNPNIIATYDDVANTMILEAIVEPSHAAMSASAPLNPIDGQFWFDTDEFRSGTTRALKVWNALTLTWEYISSDLSLSTTNTWTSKNTYTNGIIIGLDAAPSNPVHGQIYYNKILNRLNVWDGLLWKEVSGSGGDGGGGLTLIPTDDSAPASTFFVGLVAPPLGATTLGDLWIDVDDDAGATEFIFAGPEAPENYNTDTLWIDTDEPITELIYSADEPANPSYTGELWIDLDDTAGQSIVSSLTPPTPEETDLWIDLANEEGYLEYKDLFKNGAAVVQAFANLPSAPLYPGISLYVVLEKTIYVSVDNQWKKMYPNSDSEVLSWIGF